MRVALRGPCMGVKMSVAGLSVVEPSLAVERFQVERF
jgi:hypothetical protein